MQIFWCVLGRCRVKKLSQQLIKIKITYLTSVTYAGNTANVVIIISVL